ncbi:hypothetical protein [Paenibacillus wynnii]|uniref:Uncharacterized protein n=1 Tax=Paenibacillus wynnii TaxID=268407 RepID=A0A098M2K3_9BACL|nr:hypothetical protein [Paenibacillus wynnii]KGE16614.1 hypothetical protein PWYN_18030 [Paenibacillus wynnii]
MKLKKRSKIVFYVIKGSTIKKFLILDLVTGTGIYYALKLIYSSVLIATAGSVIGTEGINEGIKRYKGLKKHKS